jgi:hypothetical protein
MQHTLSRFAVLAALAAPALAQGIPVSLTYNWNGIVHAGEAGNPDDPNGFRSISDRALDFSAGVPNDPIFAGYQLETQPAVLDCVHLGNRNTVDGASKVFDATPDFDDVGIQPAWLPVVDQSTPQVSVLPFPMPIGATTSVAFLYQVSNGGGSFDVTFTFANNTTHTATLSGSDWFGGPLPGTQNVDSGLTGNNLSVTEGRIDMRAFDGQLVTQIAFSNRSNTNAGYAIYACNFEYPPQPRRINQIDLNYNWNGIVHVGEDNQPDLLTGYRSISDRGLDFRAGVPTNALLAPYRLVDQAGVLDCVHLGNRNTVDNGNRQFDLVPDNDTIGVQPSWLANPDQTGPQTTTLAQPILLDAASRAFVLFQISNGGGSFEVEFAFQSGAPFVAVLSGGDWFGGTLPGTASTDSAFAGANLSLTERNVDLSAHAGRTLTGITFQNRSNVGGGYLIAAMNVTGCLSCVAGTLGSVTNLGGGTGPVMTTSTNGNLGCDLDWTVLGAQPNNAAGFFLLGFGNAPLPLGSLLTGCLGTVHVPSPIALLSPADANGSATTRIVAPTAQGFCGLQITGQYIELVGTACPVRLSDAIAITIGN